MITYTIPYDMTTFRTNSVHTEHLAMLVHNIGDIVGDDVVISLTMLVDIILEIVNDGVVI